MNLQVGGWVGEWVGFFLPVALGHGKVFLAVVEEDHAHRPAVVVVNHTRAHVDVLLPGQAGTRSYRGRWVGG